MTISAVSSQKTRDRGVHIFKKAGFVTSPCKSGLSDCAIRRYQTVPTGDVRLRPQEISDRGILREKRKVLSPLTGRRVVVQ